MSSVGTKAERSDADKDEYVSKITSEQRKRMSQELHERIVRGEVDLGPAGHALDPLSQQPIRNDRDKFDPCDLGSAISTVARNLGIPYRQAADELYAGKHGDVMEFQGTGMLGAETAARYQAELRERAGRGDKYAISMLTTGQPGDSDE